MEWFLKAIEWLKGKKTYLLLASVILGAIGAYLGGEMTFVQMVAAIWAAITGGAFRAGITKSTR